MTTRSMSRHGTQGPAAAPAEQAGRVVLRDVHLRHEPRALVRPGAGGVPAVGSHPAPDEAAEAAFRAGYASAEAAFRSSQEAAFEQARAEGHARGVEEGRAASEAKAAEEVRAKLEAGQAAARAAIAERMQLLDLAVESTRAELAARLARTEEEIVSLAHAVACRILGERLVRPDGVAHLVNHVLREHAGQGAGVHPIVVHLHPRDLERMREDPSISTWMGEARSPGGGALQWAADERVGPGGCLVRSTEGTLDARLESQLAALRDVLARGVAGGVPRREDAP